MQSKRISHDATKALLKAARCITSVNLSKTSPWNYTDVLSPVHAKLIKLTFKRY